ncbi:MAG: hypothetical protein GX352_06035 [Clostridiales bacterium]|nr:hypothetical protein [Clostridiales bacterium]
MKKKVAFIMAIALVGLLAAGGVMAWFTAGPKDAKNTFTTGKLEIDLVDEFNKEDAANVNPGDCISKKVRVQNKGTIDAYIRIALTPKFTGLKEGVEPNNDLVRWTIGTDWVQGEDDWYYYTEVVDPGEFTKNLIEEVCFSKDMGNDYQGMTFTLDVKAEAIQVEHGAALDVWKVDPANLGASS